MMDFSYFKELLKKYRPFFIIIFLFLISALFLVFYGIGVNKQTEREKTMEISPAIRNLTIVSVSPINEARGIGLYPKITITFAETVTDAEYQFLILSSSPNIIGEKELSKDRKTFVFNPTKPLKTNQKYLLSLNHNNQQYSWSFSTVSMENVPLEDQIKTQAEADKNYGEWEKNVLKNYPWYNQLPLQADNYFVYFDLDKKIFIGKLYPKKSSNLSIETQVNTFKNEIITQLKTLGVDIAKFSFQWLTNPE